MLGHPTLGTTQKYTYVGPESLRDATAAMDCVLGSALCHWPSNGRHEWRRVRDPDSARRNRCGGEVRRLSCGRERSRRDEALRRATAARRRREPEDARPKAPRAQHLRAMPPAVHRRAGAFYLARPHGRYGPSLGASKRFVPCGFDSRRRLRSPDEEPQQDLFPLTSTTPCVPQVTPYRSEGAHTDAASSGNAGCCCDGHAEARTSFVHGAAPDAARRRLRRRRDEHVGRDASGVDARLSRTFVAMVQEPGFGKK